MLRSLLVVLQVLLTSSLEARYDGYKVFRVTPQTVLEANALNELQNQTTTYDFWTDVRGIGSPVDVMVPPGLLATFKKFLGSRQMEAVTWIEDVQQLIDEEKLDNRTKGYSGHNWTRYSTLDKIYEWLESLAKKYPKVVQTIVGGRSHEGRDILGVKVSYKPGNKGVFIEAGIHAREWISPATVTYILDQLLSSNHPEVRRVAESRDWYFFPVINPDGYVYSQTTDRMWRKNRRPHGGCTGVDLNRNWGYRWNSGGVSHNPCSEIYLGPSAFSEIETKSLSDYITRMGRDLEMYLDFHSYSQYLMVPYGHSGNEVPPNNAQLKSIGRKAVKKLAERYGTRYDCDNIPTLLGHASGSSADWAMATHSSIKMTYIYELRDRGRYGFILPPQQIIPSGEETLDSLLILIQEADKLA